MLKNREKKTYGYITNSLVGAALGALLCCGVLLLLSFLVSSEKISEEVIGEGTVAAAFLCSLFGSMVAIRRNKRQPLLCGVLTAAVLMAVRLIVSAFISDGSLFDSADIKIFTALIAGGLLSGFVSAGKKGKKRRK